MQRRRLLQVTGALAAIGLAGCLGGGPGSPDEGTDGPTDMPADGGGGSPGTRDTSFEVVTTRCGTQANEAEVTFGDGQVTVEGTTWGNDACYTARPESVSRDGGTLTLRVAAERPESEDRGCAQCISEIEYRATVQTTSTPDEVVVIHRGETVATASP